MSENEQMSGGNIGKSKTIKFKSLGDKRKKLVFKLFLEDENPHMFQSHVILNQPLVSHVSNFVLN